MEQSDFDSKRKSFHILALTRKKNKQTKKKKNFYWLFTISKKLLILFKVLNNPF